MRLFIHDFGGYAFPFQLSKALARRGHEVLHVYYGSHQTTPSGIDGNQTEAIPHLEIRPIALTEVLDKYNFYKRWRQETEYGHVVASVLKNFKPDLVLSANTPLDAQKTLIQACQERGIPFVFWLQDLLGLATYKILRRKIPIAGHLVGKYYMALEKKLLQKSDGIIAIDFKPFLQRTAIPSDVITYIQNWAPIDQLPVLEKKNSWSTKQGLDDKFCFLYAGTLSMKHNPNVLIQLAAAFRHQSDVRIVVVSSGMGATWLQKRKIAHNLSNLLIFPYQPLDALPEVLATADVTVTLLDASAGTFSVPSKVLTYLCAGRPLLMAVPTENQASQIVQANNAGLISPPGTPLKLIEDARKLKDDARLRAEAGRHARMLAKKLFDIERITDSFESVFVKTCNQDAASASQK